tara:strand:+ start:109 stop:786 length:678 start_codon:yes stop_codon:yes gene_type:complete
MTYREVINEVLIRLRETPIASDWSGSINDSSTVSDYNKVIGALVNDAKRSIESYHDWQILRETVNITTVADTKNYSLSSGQEFKIIDVINNATGNELLQVSRAYLNRERYPTASTGEPHYYGFNGADSSNNLKVDLSPTPSKAETISFDIVKYQDALTTASTVVKIPTKPLILGAYARALSERGEDGGTQSSLAAQEAGAAISQAIMMDAGNTQFESDWFMGNIH